MIAFLTEGDLYSLIWDRFSAYVQKDGVGNCEVSFPAGICPQSTNTVLKHRCEKPAKAMNKGALKNMETRKMARLLKYMTKERFLLYCALTAGVILLLLQAAFSVDMFRDSAGVYSPMARALANGSYQEAFHPGIPCLNVLLSFPLTGLGIAPETALSIISSAFYIGTIPFIYLLLKLFLPGILSSAGALFFACAPKIIRFSCSAIIDSGKIFFLTAALFFLLKFMAGKYRSWKYALFFGISAGGMSLARSEGFGNALVLFGCLGLYWCIDGVKERKIQPLLPAAASFFAWLGCLLIRVGINWKFCGIPTFDIRISDGLSRIFSSAPAAVSAASAVKTLRVSWADLFNQNLRGCYELYFFLGLLGLFLMIFPRKKVWASGELPGFVKRDMRYWIFLIVPVTNALIFKASDIAAYRYFLLNIPCLLVFTMTGACFLWQWITRFVPPRLSAAGVLILLICQLQNGAANFFSAKSRRQYETGRKIGQMLEEEKGKAKVLFRTASIEWYYSGLDRALPVESDAPELKVFTGFDYVLWDKDEQGMEILTGRRDLREIPLPGTEDVRLFRRLK